MNYTHGDIVTMMSAAEALDYIDHHLDKPELLPNLILLDLDMPSINGFGFLERFNCYADSLKATCPVVVLTASNVLSDIEKIKSHPDVVKLIAKPLSKESLALVI